MFTASNISHEKTNTEIVGLLEILQLVIFSFPFRDSPAPRRSPKALYHIRPCRERAVRDCPGPDRSGFVQGMCPLPRKYTHVKNKKNTEYRRPPRDIAVSDVFFPFPCFLCSQEKSNSIISHPALQRTGCTSLPRSWPPRIRSGAVPKFSTVPKIHAWIKKWENYALKIHAYVEEQIRSHPRNIAVSDNVPYFVGSPYPNDSPQAKGSSHVSYHILLCRERAV